MHKEQKLIDAVLDRIAEDVSIEDFTAIEEMLKQILDQKFTPITILSLYLPNELKKWNQLLFIKAQV